MVNATARLYRTARRCDDDVPSLTIDSSDAGEIPRFGMRRREFIMLLSSAAVTWPCATRAERSAVPVIGLLGSDAAPAQSEWTDAFLQRLRELGWSEGRNIIIDYRWSEGHAERFSEIAAEFVQRKVTVILTHTTPPTLAAKQATSTIPIVFATAGDPIGAGIVPSLARPGGNITGLSSQIPDAAGKRLELFQQVVPGLRRLATLADVDNPYAALDLRQFNEAAGTLGIEVLSFEIRRSEELDSVFDALKRRADALYVLPVPLSLANRARINAMALNARLPTLYAVREYVEAGGLMSYGPNWPSMWRRAADLVDKILRGAKPAEIPVEQPSEFDLAINLITAKALGLTIPDKLLALANAVIE
jgi:putative ABC transport system substrate-binding protein